MFAQIDKLFFFLKTFLNFGRNTSAAMMENLQKNNELPKYYPKAKNLTVGISFFWIAYR